MTCEELERFLPEFLEAEPGALPGDVAEHVQSCPMCSDLVSDLNLISNHARQLAESNEPAARVWVNIAAELRAEGVIRDQDPAFLPARPRLVPAPAGRRWSDWWLAPIAAAMLRAGAYVISHKPAPTVAFRAPAPSMTAPPSRVTAPAPSPVPETSAPPAAASVQMAKTTAAAAGGRKRLLQPPPTAEDQQFLSAVSTLAPSTRASYENELQAVNADIQETQAYVDRYPGDADARQHLMDAYQQKALLYQIALDRIQ